MQIDQTKKNVQNLITRHPDLLVGLGMFVFTLALYVATLAPGLVFGDPSEYTLVPHIWGISHPPGYAFQTVLGGIWQRIIPIGSIAYRANLLSAAAGATIAALLYGIVKTLTPRSLKGLVAYMPGVIAGVSSTFATDIWQHSIHANAHIVTALLAVTSLFLLMRWWHSGQESGDQDDRWLYAFCVVAGLSVTHHPLLVFSFPAYAIFILVVKPRVLFEPTVGAIFASPRLLLDWQQWLIILKKPHLAINWKTPLKMIGFALIGLSVWLYLPIRASLPAPLLFGPDNTNTLNGFLDLVLARGLRVNLFHFGLKDQPARWGVFFSLLRLQVSPAIIVLMALGLAWAWAKHWRVGLLFTLFLGVNLAFILNTIQDVMAYLMSPFAALIGLGGIGVIAILEQIRLPKESESRLVQIFFTLVTLFIPLGRGVALTSVVSLRHYDEAQQWIDEVYDRFEGKEEGAILLAHWEHLTPLWYMDWVEDRTLDGDDVRLVFVATTSEHPWVDNVWANIDEGPIYVSGFQRELIDEGFRLRPTTGRMYRVLPAPAIESPEMQITLDADVGPVTVVGFDLPVTTVEQGDVIPLNIALYAEDPPADIIFPYTTLGIPDSEELPLSTYQYTTDSHWLTPWWQPGEIIVERYDLRAPLDAPPGEYPLRLGIRNLNQGEDLTFPDGERLLDLGTVTIKAAQISVPLEEGEIMADIAHQAGLVNGIVSGNGQRRIAPWNEPLVVNPGDDIRVNLTWTVLDHPDENWKVFVHLIDGGNQVIAQQDAPPLGGSFPTFLWFPKWVPGQTVFDPYRLTVPADTPPGDYQIEVGMYGFTTFQRAHFYDPAGNLSGDRFILGTVRVEP